MRYVVIPLKIIRNNINVLHNFLLCHVPLYYLSHYSVEMLHYLHFYVLLSGEMVDNVFLQQFSHVSVIEILTLVCLKFHRRSRVFKYSS